MFRTATLAVVVLVARVLSRSDTGGRIRVRANRATRYVVSAVWSLLVCAIALGFAGQACGQVNVISQMYIANGTIDLGERGFIVPIASVGFVPNGGQVNEFGTPGVAEYGTAAVSDAIEEGANFAHGYWNGTNAL